MPSLDNLEQTPRRVMPIFYVLDTSGSMEGAAMAQLNRAMEETVDALKKVASGNADATLKIAVLEFNSGFKWVQQKGLEEIEDFVWEDLIAGGLTQIGAALKELDSKLSENAFLGSMTGAFCPIIIFMTDGLATDDYEKPLQKIRKNKWFRGAVKIGFALGDAADVNMIANIVGNGEAVIKTSNLAVFAKMIKFASVTASMLNSKSKTDDEGTTGADIVGMGVEDGSISDKDIGHGTVTIPDTTPKNDDDDLPPEWE